jgi:Uma2 family endonuclease
MALTTSREVFSAAERLPPGARLVVHDFCWQDYDRLLEIIGDRSNLRVSFDSGRLEIVSPSRKHDNYSRMLDFCVAAFCEVRGLDFQMYGSATWRSSAIGKGVEPDACYYVRNVNRVLGQKDIELGTHPPPDIAVEIDVTNSSLAKLSIYAALGVPEVWRYDGQAFTFYVLTDVTYSETSSSRQLSGLTGPILLEALEDCETRGPLVAAKALRRRLRVSKR